MTAQTDNQASSSGPSEVHTAWKAVRLNVCGFGLGGLLIGLCAAPYIPTGNDAVDLFVLGGSALGARRCISDIKKTLSRINSLCACRR
jgi:hypothetical protein